MSKRILILIAILSLTGCATAKQRPVRDDSTYNDSTPARLAGMEDMRKKIINSPQQQTSASGSSFLFFVQKWNF